MTFECVLTVVLQNCRQISVSSRMTIPKLIIKENKKNWGKEK